MYTALYRKWRPSSFDDVISQPHITKTLKNQINNGRTAHAYLFTGSRGTGKTTCARIFAKAVNCEHSHEGNPCLECDICREAEKGALSDIIEIDAASNNGVDDIRELRDGAVYTPERCRYKVYIIDEVHMLSASAFNALLKIMEEPPSYVKFILATTEVHKVPATITSRCQRFDFRRILPEDISARLLYIAQREGLTLTDDAAALIARLSDGGMRDALSLLDQCAAYSENIDKNTVSAAAGIAGRDSLFEIAVAAVSKDPASALAVADRLYSMSKDMGRLCVELTDLFRDIMLMKVCPENTGLISCMPDELEEIKKLAEGLKLSDVLAKLDVLQECGDKMSKALNKRVEFEMCLIRLCSARAVSRQPAAETVQAERPSKQAAERKLAGAVSEDTSQREVRPEVDMKTVRPSDFKMLAQWSDVIEELAKTAPSVAGALSGSRAFVCKNVMLIDTKNRFFVRLFDQVKDNAEKLGNAVEAVLGKRYVIRIRRDKNAEEKADKTEGLIEKAISSGIETAVE